MGRLRIKYQGRIWRLRDPETLLGRSRSCDIIVGSPLASRVHARLVLRSGALQLVDPGSRNGTTLNGEAVSGSSPVTEGDRIGIGSDILELVGDADESHLKTIPPPSGDEEVTRSVRGVNVVEVLPVLLEECERPGRAAAVLPQLRDAVRRFLDTDMGTTGEEVANVRGMLRAARVRIDHPEFQTWVEGALARLS